MGARKRSDKNIFAVSKVAKLLPKIVENNSSEICVTQKKTTVVKVDVNTMHILSRQIDEYDKLIANAVYTLWERGDMIFTEAMVYRTINGLSNTEKVRQRQIDDIKSRLDKLSLIRVRIDATEHARLIHKGTKSFVLESYLLPLEHIKFDAFNADEIDCYKLMKEPAVLEYSKAVHQVVSVDRSLIDTRSVIRNNADVAVIRANLIQFVEAVKNENNNFHGTRLTYKELFDKIDPNMSRQVQSKKRQQISKILDYYVSIGYIKAYESDLNGITFDV